MFYRSQHTSLSLLFIYLFICFFRAAPMGYEIPRLGVESELHLLAYCGAGCRCSSNLVLLILWCKLAAAALIWPLAWELPCVTGMALKRPKKKKKRKEMQSISILGVPVVAQWLWIRLGTMRLRVRSLHLLSGLTIQRCRELWCRLQMRLGSRVAVALV